MPLMNYHQKLYYRNILYTGVTRARRMMIMLGQQDTVFRMVANHRKILRYTGLARFLTESISLLEPSEDPFGLGERPDMPPQEEQPDDDGGIPAD